LCEYINYRIKTFKEINRLIKDVKFIDKMSYYLALQNSAVWS
jgi:hypothetical protein